MNIDRKKLPMRPPKRPEYGLGDFPRLQSVGGPFDGYIHRFTWPEKWMVRYVALPVNARVVSLLQREFESETGPATCVAVDSLKTERGRPRYEFLAATHPHDFQLEYWTG
jgi:hypothetical protein